MQFSAEEYTTDKFVRGYAVAQLVGAQHYKPEATDSIPDGVIVFPAAL